MGSALDLTDYCYIFFPLHATLKKWNHLKTKGTKPSKNRLPHACKCSGREPARMKHWEENGVYSMMQERNKVVLLCLAWRSPVYQWWCSCGTALNKILKDSILRFKNSRGFRTPYIPGWDCHGLPIEHKVTKNYGHQDWFWPYVRQECEEFSKSYIETQRAQFKRLGDVSTGSRNIVPWTLVWGEILRHFRTSWNRVWYTEVKVGLLVIHVKLHWRRRRLSRIMSVHLYMSVFYSKVSRAMSTWYLTTTPWHCLPTCGCSTSPKLTDRCRGCELLDCPSSSGRIAKECGLEDFSITDTCLGEVLAGQVTRHPFIDRTSKVVSANMAMDTGTGCVHIAPGHD